jgi:carboxyl-terminal processing protease
VSGRRIAIAVALSLGVTWRVEAQDSLRAPTRKRTLAEDLQLFSQVLNQLRVNHPDSLDSHELLMSAIAAMVQAADPHSYVIPAARLDTAKMRLMREGSLYPVPVSFSFVSGAPLVVSVDAGSRAVSQDILPGDELVAASGRPIAAESPDELSLALSGPKGSTVALTLRRRRFDGSVVRLERQVRRERTDEASAVPVATLLDAQTGYVRVTTFASDKVADDLHAALERLERAGMQRLLLDLRGNGGGLVKEAKQIAGEFLPRGAIVYTASGRKAEVTDTGRVQRSFWRSERRYPIVILVDEGTASASELVAGALQDHDRALIIGRPTFGKSLLMQTLPLTDGSFIALVIGQLRTPCGRLIQRAYHGIARRDYYRDAGMLADTATGPTCRTVGGRIVRGGGGIIPDVVLPERNGSPGWLDQLGERALILTWSGGYVDRAGTGLTTLDALAAAKALAPSALADFRSYAKGQGIDIPADPSADATLERALLRMVAFAKFGDAGYYRLSALTDPTITRAIEAFGQASSILEPRKP